MPGGSSADAVVSEMPVDSWAVTPFQGESGRCAGCRPRCVGRQDDAVGQVEHVVEPVLARGGQLHVADPRWQRLEPADGALDVQQGGRDAGQVLATQGEGEDHDDDEAGERGCVGREDQAADDDALLVGAVLDHLGEAGEPGHLPADEVAAR